MKNTNPYVTILPNEGTIQPMKSRLLKFLFRPEDSGGPNVQNQPISIDSDVTPSVVLEVFGAGGTPRLAFDATCVNNQLDFGRCLISRRCALLID